jgi:CRP/FNR family transcriptional regulator, cyclic AMP receptor protein
VLAHRPPPIGRAEEADAMADKVELLEHVPLFAEMSHDQLEELSGIVREVDVKPGDVLTHEGRHEGYFFVVVDGSVGIERGGQTINTLGPGDFLGEIALLDGGPRTATATATVPTRLLSLEQKAFDDLMDSSPTIRTAVMEAVGQRLRAIDDEAPI